MSPPSPDDRRYWSRTLRVSALVLGVWLLATVGLVWLMPGPAAEFAGWPLGFWLNAQGAMLLYCALVWAYCWWMDRIEAESGARADVD